MSAVVTLSVETDDFVRAAEWVDTHALEPLGHRMATLWSQLLLGVGGMAGDDPGGSAWAASYDPAAAAAGTALCGALNSCSRLHWMFRATAYNYEIADHASTPGWDLTPPPGPEPAVTSTPASFASAAGPGSGAPAGWSLVEHLVGYVWPNGHQDLLHVAADAWTAAGATCSTAAGYLRLTASSTIHSTVPEYDDITVVVATLADRLDSLGDTMIRLGRSCDALADHIDEVHSAVEHELASLAEQTAIIEGGGLLLSFVTFGGAEGAAQAVEASRVSAVAGRIGELIGAFLTQIGELVDALPSLEEMATSLSRGMEDLLGRDVAYAGVTRVGALPERLESEGITRLEMSADERMASDAGHVPKNASRDGGIPGATSNESKLAREFGATRKEIKRAIHTAKHVLRKGDNPDVVVAPDGEVYPLGRDGFVGDSIGNILDYLDSHHG